MANRYLAPVTSFRDRTGQTIGVIFDFYSSRNSDELDIYLQMVASLPSLKSLDICLPLRTMLLALATH